MSSTGVSRIENVDPSVAIKAPCRLATTGNITLSGLQTIDSVAGSADDRVLVIDQTDASENGVWIMSTSDWQRARDFDGNRDVVTGTLIKVTHGTTYGGAIFKVTTANPIVIGTSNLAFSVDAQFTISSGIRRYDSMAALIAAQPSEDSVYVTSYYGGWAATVAGPTGGHYRHKTGATNASPTVGSAVSVSTIGTGTQAGYCWDASGNEWFITADVFFDASWFGIKGNGTDNDLPAFNDFVRVVKSFVGCTANVPPPTTYYRLNGILEIADCQGITFNFAGNPDTALAAYDNYLFKYHGSLLTGYENPVIRLVGNSFCTFNGLTVDANSLADHAFWISGLNSYTGSAPTTANRYRSIGCEYNKFSNLNANVAGCRYGESTSTSSQTDTSIFNRCTFRGTETGAAVDTTPVTRGMEIFGANTYGTTIELEVTGDTGVYHDAGAMTHIHPYALQCDVAGFYSNSAGSQVTLIAPYAEGLDGRPIATDTGESSGSKPLSISGGVFFWTTPQSMRFRSNQPVVITGTFGYGWITDNYASSHERPIYVDLGNKWASPTDTSSNANLNAIQYSHKTAGGYNDMIRYFKNLHVSVKDESAAPFTIPEGASFHSVIVVNGASGNTATLPSAKAGISGLRLYKLGDGTAVGSRAGSDIIRDVVSGTSRTTARLATANDRGYLEFSCVVDGEWIVSGSSGTTVTYT